MIGTKNHPTDQPGVKRMATPDSALRFALALCTHMRKTMAVTSISTSWSDATMNMKSSEAR